MRKGVRLPAVFLAAVALASCSGRSDDGAGSGGGTLDNQPPAAGAPAQSAAPPAAAPPAEPPAAAPQRPAPAEAAAKPAPRPRVVTLPKGTTIDVELETAVSSATSKREDLVVARVTDDVRVDGRVVLRAGSEVRGRVTAAVPSGRVKGRARLAVVFDRVEVQGRRYGLDATSIDITAGSTVKRDAALIGGGALAGAVVKGKKGAGIGALLGGGAVLVTKGKEVTLPAGTPVQLKLKSDLRLD